MRDIVRHSLIYTLANLASRGALVVSLLVLPFFLTPAQYGVLGLVATIAAFVSVTVPLEVSQGLARYYATAPSGERLRLAGTAWWFTVGMLGGAAILALLFAEPLAAQLFGSGDYADALKTAIGFFVCNTLLFFLQGQCRWEFRVLDYVWISVGYAIATLALTLALAATARDALEGALAGQLIGGALVVTAGMLRLKGAIFHRPRAAELRRMLAFSLPLVPASIALSAAAFANRLILNANGTLADVGVFTFASQIASMPGLTILGIQAALTPLVMARHEEPETPAAIARLFEWFVALACPVCAAFGLFAGPAVRLLGHSDYAAAAPLVMVLAPAFIGLQIYVFSPGFAIARRTGTQMLVTISTTGAGLLLSFILTDLFGAWGAAWATLAGAALFSGVWFALSDRLYRVPVRWWRVAALLLAWAAVGWAGWALPELPLWPDLAARSALLVALLAIAPALGLVTARDVTRALSGWRSRRS